MEIILFINIKMNKIDLKIKFIPINIAILTISDTRTKINDKSGLGLGIFLGKTLLERQGAKLNFSNQSKSKGASVKIIWNSSELNFSS